MARNTRCDPAQAKEARPTTRPTGQGHHPLSISQDERTVANMWTTLLVLLVVWVVLAIVGFTFQGLLWLAIIGIVLFVATLIFGAIRTRTGRRSS